ncbi:MAG: type II secretion system F family protein [Halieaceae bacterium]|jgi:general secretion pathway protein F|nr:type II secretion system F family protein [Halieaceae bacterium]
MKFSYQAFTRDGELVSGLIDAASQREAQRQLEAQGVSPFQFSSAQNRPAAGRRRLRQDDIIQALDEFCTLLESGVGIAESVEALQQGEYHPTIGSFFSHVATRLQSGESLSAAISSGDLPLPPVVLQLVSTGEATGELSASLREAVSQLQYDAGVRDEFRSALIYPAVLVFSGIGAIVLIFAFVVPKFANLVEGNDDMPLLASLVINGGLWFNQNWPYLLAAVAVLVALLVTRLRSQASRARLLNAAARLPLIGGWLDERDIGNWSSSMAALLNNSVELVTALGLARNSVQLDLRRQRLLRVEQAVRSGDSLSDALRENRVLSPTAYNLVRVGEKTGRLPQMMRSVSAICEKSRKGRTAQLLALIEPAAILIIGAVIGVMILGVILAITSVNDVAF